MTLYTVVPLESVFNGYNEESVAHQEVWIAGVYMQVEPIAPGMGKIIRLLHCALDDYLRPELAPGSIVSYGSDSQASQRS